MRRLEKKAVLNVYFSLNFKTVYSWKNESGIGNLEKR